MERPVKDDIALPDAARPSVPTELVARLEVASVGSPELSADIAEWAGDASKEHWAAWREEWRTGHVWHDAAHCPPSPYTTSLDAALALAERVLPGQEYEITTLYGVARVSLNLNHGCDGGPFYGENVCCCVPLALCAAVLKATSASSVGISALRGNEPDTPPETGTGTEGGR
jgi:hypothetical protein